MWVSPRELKPWAKNPRHNDGAVDAIAQSIARYGFGAPIVARKATREIIGGHTRWKAAQKLGLAQVPVRFLDISERDAHALALADNKLGELSEWDDAQLAELLQSLEPAEQLLVGWSADEVSDLLAEVNGKPDVAEDEVPEPPKVPVTQVGDVWELGRHRLICGDNRAGPAGFTVTSIDLLLADPPYGVSERTERKTNGRGKLAECNDFEPVAGDDRPFDPSPFRNFPRAILWGANYFCEALPSMPSWLIWDKRDGIPSNDNADCELAWSNLGGPARVFRHTWNGMIKASERGERRVHPTQKPVALMLWCLERAGLGVGAKVYDPFMGSGPVLIACEHRAAACFGYELSPAYCDVIIERWQNLTGDKAKRL